MHQKRQLTLALDSDLSLLPPHPRSAGKYKWPLDPSLSSEARNFIMSDAHNFLRELGQSLADFLERELPRITGKGRWERSVLSVLTPMQLDNVKRRQITGLAELDLAALLRVLDQNRYEISRHKSLPWEVRNFIKETHSIRNRWVHAGIDPVPKEDT